MKKVITYGTYDFLHQGHINVLNNAKALGDYLIVGVTSDEFDRSRGKLDVWQSLPERIAAVQETGIADEIIVEEYEGQKISDIQKYDVDVFTVGSDWVGKFDYLKEFCEVVYLPRTEGVSSTQIREESNAIIKLGIIGHNNPAERVIEECKTIKGIETVAIYSEDKNEATWISERTLIDQHNTEEELLDTCDAVYVVTDVDTHYSVIKRCLEAGKHVMCEGPMFMNTAEATECFNLARDKGLVLMDAVKTRFFPGFKHLMLLIKSGKIGDVKDIDVSISQNLQGIKYDELSPYKGAVYTLSGYSLLPIFQLLGDNYESLKLYSSKRGNVDSLTEGFLKYKNAIARFKEGLGIKTEGHLIITGTKGYVYVPAPWWRTDYFEVRYEDLRDTKKYFWQYEGEGFRYELMEFRQKINNKEYRDNSFPENFSVNISAILDMYSNGEYEEF